ncbi:MAG: hypothetical protein QF570_13315 [Myxococcota bacterium]|jgi:hypothetical protein|nr:hypothetical protein [Myxococcota bacterium]
MARRPVAQRAPFLFASPGQVGRWSAITLLCCGFVVSCSGDDAPKEASDEAALPVEITGRYKMSGVTTTPGSDQKRKIRGTIILEQKGDKYTASYEFKTSFPGEGQPVDADVIGVGDGDIQGRKLIGTAKTQIVVSSVPGVDTGFAFAPRRVSARIVSNSTAEYQADGTFEVEIESRADEGETDYQATRTRMRGKRIGDIGAQPLGGRPGFPKTTK